MRITAIRSNLGRRTRGGIIVAVSGIEGGFLVTASAQPLALTQFDVMKFL